MNNDTNNKGYIFAGLFDITLYGFLAVVFPLLNLLIAITETPFWGLQDVYDLLFAEFFVTATFFYDFHSRYGACNDQTTYVVNVLFYGRLLFFAATMAVFVLMFLITKGFPLNDIKTALTAIAFLGLYPALLAMLEAIKRLKNEKKRKISKTN